MLPHRRSPRLKPREFSLPTLKKSATVAAGHFSGCDLPHVTNIEDVPEMFTPMEN